MTTVKILKVNYYQIRNNMHLIVTSAYEFTVLCALIQCSDSDGCCFPSQQYLRQGIMSRNAVTVATNSLENKGYIIIEHHHTARNINLSYTVNFAKIYQDIETLELKEEADKERVPDEVAIDNKVVSGPEKPPIKDISYNPQVRDNSERVPVECSNNTHGNNTHLYNDTHSLASSLKNKTNIRKDVKNEDNDKLLLEETPALKRIYPTLDIDAEIVRFKESNPNYKEMGNIANEIFTWCYSASSLQRVC